MPWLTFIHIGALAVWMAGLLYLPTLLWRHHDGLDAQDFARIRMSSRFVYLLIVSPAACVAIGAGISLIFVRDALHPWMFLKLGVVGVLAFCHYRYGSLLVHLAEDQSAFPKLQASAIAAAVAVSLVVVLWLVLAKPEISLDPLPHWVSEPGFLTSVPPPRLLQGL